MEYSIKREFRPEFGGRVEVIYVGGRRVGMVYRDPKPSPEDVDEWVAKHRGGQLVHTREDAIREVLRHAQEEPDFAL